MDNSCEKPGLTPGSRPKGLVCTVFRSDAQVIETFLRHACEIIGIEYEPEVIAFCLKVGTSLCKPF